MLLRSRNFSEAQHPNDGRGDCRETRGNAQRQCQLHRRAVPAILAEPILMALLLGSRSERSLGYNRAFGRVIESVELVDSGDQRGAK